MPKFTSLNKIGEYIQENLNEVLNDHIVDRIIDVQMEKIEEIVYLPYEPKMYQRRYEDNGLLDRSNITAYPLFNGKYYSIVNETRKKGVQEYLAPLVEYGHGVQDTYDYPRRGLYYMRPRPFTHETYEHFATTNEHVDMMKRAMKAKGFKVR